MTVRDFTPSDREEYIAMSADFYSGDGALHPIGKDHFENTFDHILTGNDSSVRGVILEQDGKTAGYSLIVKYWSCEAGGQTEYGIIQPAVDLDTLVQVFIIKEFDVVD